jgi:tRNA (cytidine/uridine-2'-O-)-methyltransferase
MVHVALLEPEIPPNTGNVARLCAANGVPLHLIGRLGFRLNAPALRRAGLDYWHAVDIRRHVTLEEFERSVGVESRTLASSGAGLTRLLCFSAHAEALYTSVAYRPGDCLLFGSESRGLPASLLQRPGGHVLRIPMLTGNVRSLNLATAVGIVLYEALRQIQEWR